MMKWLLPAIMIIAGALGFMLDVPQEAVVGLLVGTMMYITAIRKLRGPSVPSTSMEVLEAIRSLLMVLELDTLYTRFREHERVAECRGAECDLLGRILDLIRRHPAVEHLRRSYARQTSTAAMFLIMLRLTTSNLNALELAELEQAVSELEHAYAIQVEFEGEGLKFDA